MIYMQSEFTVWEWLELMDISQFDIAQDDATGTNFFASDVPEEKVRYPWALIISEQNGAANTFDLSKIEEDNTETVIIPNFNLAANESIMLSVEDLGPVLPRLEGGTNLEIQAGLDGVDATVFYFDGPEV